VPIKTSVHVDVADGLVNVYSILNYIRFVNSQVEAGFGAYCKIAEGNIVDLIARQNGIHIKTLLSTRTGKIMSNLITP
jgi:hypothetical protein